MLYHVILEVYVFFINAVAIVSSIAFVGGLLFVPDLEFIKISSTSTCTSTLVFVTAIGLLTLGKRQDFSELSERAGRIYDICSSDPLDIHGRFTKTFTRNNKMLIKYTTYLLGLTTVVAVLYVLPGYIQNFKSLGFSGDSDLEFPLWMPFEYKESPYLDVAFFIEVAAILIAGWRKTCSECLLLSYLHCQIQFLRHMKYTLKTVFENKSLEEDSPTKEKSQLLGGIRGSQEKIIDCQTSLHVCELQSQEEKLRHWITVHQEVLKLVSFTFIITFIILL